jgi:carboxyl-terminal processing protease
MLMMRKRSLALIIIVFMVISAVGTGVILFLGGLSTGGLVVIPRSEFQAYQAAKEKYATLTDLENYINENYYVPVDQKELQVGMYKGLFMGIGDPYSSYLTKKEFDDIMMTSSGEFQGIGVTISPDENGFINVIAPIEDTPAERAGIKSGDKIVKVDDKEYSSVTINEAVTAMRGEPGTKVLITVLRKGKLVEYKLTRSNIVLKSVKSEILENGIGYIHITTFDEKTGEEFRNHLKDLQAQKVTRIILDLRDNPGGVVDASVEVADMLLGAGVITYTEDRAGNKEYYKSDANKLDLPFVVLINKGSASASEILAGAIKDFKAAKIVGETSFGKGIIQRITPYGNEGGGIKLTVMQYFSPDGNIIHKKGVEPDFKVEILDTDYVDDVLPRENDKQLQKAIELLQ